MITRIVAPASLTLLMMLLGAVPLRAQRNLSTVRVTANGVIMDLTANTPLNGALVEFPALRRQTVTDTAGKFSFTNIRPGRHSMVVSQLGYKTLKSDIDFRDNELLVINLEPDPVALKGLEIQVDRLASRRKGVAVAVNAFERASILNSIVGNTAEFVRTRLMLLPCSSSGTRNCLHRRGSLIQPTVYIDEKRAFGGLQELDMYPTHDIYLIEAYEQGRMIRVYTIWYMQTLARTNTTLPQIIIW